MILKKWRFECEKILSRFLNFYSITLLSLSKNWFLTLAFDEKESLKGKSVHDWTFWEIWNIWKSLSLSDGKLSLSVFLRMFLIFGNLSLDDSYKLDPYKKKMCSEWATKWNFPEFMIETFLLCVVLCFWWAVIMMMI